MSWNVEEAIAWYRKQGAPQDQNMLISLLREIQTENGGSIPEYMVRTVADACGLKESFLYAIIRRIPSLRLSMRHHLELCCGANCGKYTALAACAEELCRSRANISLKFVPCMRMCGKGPNIRWNGVIYHKASEELIRRLLDTDQKGRA